MVETCCSFCLPPRIKPQPQQCAPVDLSVRVSRGVASSAAVSFSFPFSSSTSHIPPATKLGLGKVSCSLSTKPRRSPQFWDYGDVTKSGFLLACQDSGSVSDSCRPKRSAAPSSGRWENCTLRAVIGKLCYEVLARLSC